MQTAIKLAIEELSRSTDLSSERMEEVIGQMLSGQCSLDEMCEFLTLLQRKTETVTELVGAASAMRRAMVRVEHDFPVVVDTCGTGGDGSQTFNISTAAAIVIAAAGVPVAKHGNRKITSSTGSADVLAELGINLDAPVEVVQRCLNELKLCFCFAPRFHPAMKHVAEARKRVTGPTIFNRLGPLSNPASANRQVLGVGDIELQRKLAFALLQLGTDRSIVVRGQDGVDEVSLDASTDVYQVPGALASHQASDNDNDNDKDKELSRLVWSPEEFGLSRWTRESLFADSPQSSARCILEGLNGKPSAYRDAIVINAAAGLWLAGHSPDLRACAALAQSTIDTQSPLHLIHRLSTLTH